MKTSKKRIEDLRNHGYELDFTNTFNVAFEAYKKMALIAGAVIIIIALIGAVLFGGAAISAFGLSQISESMIDFKVQNLSSAWVALYVVGMAAFSGVSAVITAGLIKMAHNAYTTGETSMGTAFQYFKDSHFGDIFIAGFVIALGTGGVSTALELSGVPIVGGIIGFIISVFAVMSIPLIIFADLKAIDAITTSFSLVSKNALLILALIIISIIIACVGFIALCIGIFFTLPFVYAMYYSIYVNAVGIEDDTEFNDIGTTFE